VAGPEGLAPSRPSESPPAKPVTHRVDEPESGVDDLEDEHEELGSRLRAQPSSLSLAALLLLVPRFFRCHLSVSLSLGGPPSGPTRVRPRPAAGPSSESGHSDQTRRRVLHQSVALGGRPGGGDST
jgi:hypothetical protein